MNMAAQCAASMLGVESRYGTIGRPKKKKTF
jgi:hypothetical protein